MADTLTADRLRELLHYDPDTGVFKWRVARSNVPAGAIAGGSQSRGYYGISVDGRLYKTHRLDGYT
jgi:hypothetical protein